MLFVFCRNFTMNWLLCQESLQAPSQDFFLRLTQSSLLPFYILVLIMPPLFGRQHCHPLKPGLQTQESHLGFLCLFAHSKPNPPPDQLSFQNLSQRCPLVPPNWPPAYPKHYHPSFLDCGRDSQVISLALFLPACALISSLK